jgi:SAM-dependent methyltransferase
MSDWRLEAGQVRVLVVIASYGQKNLPFLQRIIQRYYSMAMEVDIVVCSERPKELGPEVRVVVGLPSRNPWSLPFAHKAIFAENVELYDLFVYSEDDIEVGEDQIRAFVRAAPQVALDEIPGYLRYEIDLDGTKLITDMRDAFHWKPETVKRRGEYTVAEFTNEHSGFYILTQSQLRRAIASGGFLKAPYEGRYGLPETAATDPYTCCGFRKVICISALQKFLIRHMSNKYVGQLNVGLSSFEEQIEILSRIRDGLHPASTLCEPETRFLHARWSKNYYEKPNETLLGLVPSGAEHILSVGCGSGALEARLQARGARVTALPLDSVIGGAAAGRGIEMVYGSLGEGFAKLGGREFDCVVISDLLHLQADPNQLLSRCCHLVAERGALVVEGPHFDRLGTWLMRVLGVGEHRKLCNYESSGITVCGPGTLTGPLRKEGLRVTAVRWLNHALLRGDARSCLRLGRLSARDWVLQARRQQLAPPTSSLGA